MNRFNYLIAVSCLFLFSCKKDIGPKNKQALHPLHSTLDTYFSALTALDKFNGVLLCKENDTLVLFKSYNIDTTGQSPLFVGRSSQFDIHSISKLMARYQLYKLEKEGKLSMKQKLSQFIADFPRGDEIPLELLAQHRSGLPRELSHAPENLLELGPKEVIECAMKESLLFEPGSDTQYSNIGYQLLYAIIGMQQKTDYARTIVTDLFDPIHMEHSGSHFGPSKNKLKRLASNHELTDTGFTQVANISNDEFRQARIFSTAQDLMYFLDAIQVDTGFVEMMGEASIGHSGGSDGIRVHVQLDVHSGMKYVLLCNIDAIPFTKTLDDVKKILAYQEVEIPRKLNRTSIVIPSKQLEKFVGSYLFPDLGNTILSTEVKRDSLLVYQDGEWIATLKPESDAIFFVDASDASSFEFVKNGEGSYDLLMDFRGAQLRGRPQ